MMEKIKESIKKFKENNKLSQPVFILCAVLPFFISDFILRYVLNFIIIPYDYKYYAVPILFNIFWVFGIVYFCYGVLPVKIGKVVYMIIYILFSVLFFVNYIYFCIFGQYMWIESVTLAGEGFHYVGEVFKYINTKVILVLLLYIVFPFLTLLLWKRPVYAKKSTRVVKCLLSFLLICALETGIQIDTKAQIKKGAWEIWDRPVLVYKTFTDANKSLNICGFYQFTFKSIYLSVVDTGTYNEEDAKVCTEFFQKNKAYSDNEMTGVLKDKKVIFVLLESMDDWVISEKYTPTIKYMMDNGINFENHYMPNVGSGYTFNAEFAMNTGFYCPSNISSASVLTKAKFPYAMPNLFKENGYNTNSFHFNGKNFYNRQLMHKSFGYNDYYCLMDYMPIEKCVQDSEVPKTEKIYEKMTEGKFFSFYISYSCHLPYNVEDNKLKGAKENYPEYIDDSLDEETRNLLLLAHDTDEFFRILIENLKRDGLYEDTVIIGVADHYAYGLNDKELLKKYTEEAGSSLYEKVPFFVFSPSLTPMSVEKCTSAIDIVPTILNLFDIESEYYMGRDAFDPDYEGYAFYPNGKWISNGFIFDPNEKKEYTSEQQIYIDNMNKKIINTKFINDFVINNDYFVKNAG